MVNYGIAEFLGIFLIGFPVLVFATIIWIVGLRWICDRFFKDDEEKNFFHHHFHYRDTKEQFLRQHSKRKDDYL